MAEITKIDMNKYFVMEREGNYLVLNLDDNFSIRYLFQKIALMNEKTRFNQKWRDLKVGDIAVALVNAILKAKEKS